MSVNAAAVNIEVLKIAPTELHIYPRETRRGKAQWAIWVKPDGSGTLFISQNQISLPKNAPDK